MRQFRCAMVAFCGLWLIVSFVTTARAGSYLETVLTSDGGPNTPSAPNIDPNLKNPWGIGFSTTSPFWTGNQAAGNSTLYTATGAVAGTTGPVAIPGGGGNTPGSPGPTGVVNNNINGVAGTGFTIIGETTPTAASFIFANLNGQISAWNGAVSPAKLAITEVTTAGASYTGLAIANNGTQDLLYAADNAAGAGHSKIAVFGQANSTAAWAPVTLPGNFIDPSAPAGSVPYNIQLLNGKLYVTYQGSQGSVGIFDTNGNFLQNVTNASLSSPWGIALAPTTFGDFGGDLLVGNRSNGQINAFNATTLALLGPLTTSNGQPLSIPGLWAITFRAAGGNPPFDANALYFDAGVNLVPGTGGNIYSDGIFGEITAVPEPRSVILLGLGIFVLCGYRHWQERWRRLQARPALAAGVASH